MADISIDGFKAQQWILDVKNELSLVEDVLRNVATACTTIPGEKDPIMDGIVSTGEKLRNFWNQMCGGFREATNLISKAVAEIGKTAGEVVEDINNVKAKIGS